MRCTETERLLVIKQLRRAMVEVVRAKLMMQAVACDPEDDESVEDLDDMVDSLAGYIDACVKADKVDNEEDDEEASDE
jgi:hypothetical protein